MRFSRRKAIGWGLTPRFSSSSLPVDQVVALVVRRPLGGDVRVARLQERHAQVDRHPAAGLQHRLEVHLRQRAVLGDLDQGPIPQPRLQPADREPVVPQRDGVELDRSQAPVVVHRPFLVELHQTDELAMLGQEMVLAQEHPLVPVDFTSRHGLPNPPSRPPGPIAFESKPRLIPGLCGPIPRSRYRRGTIITQNLGRFFNPDGRIPRKRSRHCRRGGHGTCFSRPCARGRSGNDRAAAATHESAVPRGEGFLSPGRVAIMGSRGHIGGDLQAA